MHGVHLRQMQTVLACSGKVAYLSLRLIGRQLSLASRGFKVPGAATLTHLLSSPSKGHPAAPEELQTYLVQVIAGLPHCDGPGALVVPLEREDLLPHDRGAAVTIVVHAKVVEGCPQVCRAGRGQQTVRQ